MKKEELMIGDIVLDDTGMTQTISELHPQSAVVYSKYSHKWYLGYERLTPKPITPDYLERNGFELKSGVWVRKGKVRIGWTSGKLYVGYGELPPILYIHELQHLLKMIG